MSNLLILNVATNKLKCLPDTMGNLKNLNVLDISYNQTIVELPKSLGQAQQLVDINLDGLSITYPPNYIVEGGAIAIVSFLAQACGTDYKARDEFSDAQLTCRIANTNHGRSVDTKPKDDNIQVQILLSYLFYFDIVQA